MQTGLVDQISTTASSAAALITIVGGIITYAITNFRKVRKEELTERDKQIMETFKGVQMVAQKSAESIGSNKEILTLLYKANLSPEQRLEIESAVKPYIEQADARLKAANEQAAMIKALAVKIFGSAGDVDLDPTIPREAATISQQLRSA